MSGSYQKYPNIHQFRGYRNTIYCSSVCGILFIHPASRGVAAHTAGLFRSVRGAKGGFPPWGLPKLRIFTFPTRGGP